MAHNQVYMPIFESFNNATSEGRDDSAEDSDGTAAATSLTAASAGGPSQRLRTSNKSALDDTDDKRKRASGKGKRKIAIEYIKDKKSRAVTFSKRKAGIFAKARELSTLTGSSVLLLVVSESGVVYTYTTEKFQPMVTQDVGKNMIAACLSGKVNLDDRFSSYPGAAARAKLASSEAPKRGGDILLKDAFTTQSPSPSNFASDRIPIDTNINSPTTFLPSTSQNRQYEVPLPPLPITHLSSSPISHSSPRPTSPNLVKVPRIIDETSKRTRVNENDNIGDDNSDDLSEGECEAQMRKLRRSLSIERRFEKAAEDEKPRLVRNEESSNGINQLNNQTAAGFDVNARQKDGWSFTAAEDAWSSFKERFHIPTSTSVGPTHTNGQGSSTNHGHYASAIPTSYGMSNHDFSLQDAHAAQSRSSNIRRPPQTVVLPELP